MVNTRNRILKIGIVFIIPVLSLGINFSMNRINVVNSTVSVPKSTSQNYMMHDPIIITNDMDLAAVATSGMGTVNHPYIITGWNITDSDTDGISITGTTRYFRIENCWIAKSAYQGINIGSVSQGTATIANNICTDNNDHGIILSGGSLFSIIENNTCISNGKTGIYLSYVSDNSIVKNNTCISNCESGIYSQSYFSTVVNNNCTNNNEHGIALWWSDYSQLDNNFLANNTKNGIFIRGSYFSTLGNNTCARNGEAGISLYLASSVTIFNNTCTRNNGPGIYPLYSPFSIITYNTCSENQWAGIHHYRSEHSIIVNNTFYNDGYALSPSKQEIFSCTVKDNTVNSLPLGYFENLTDRKITQKYGQLILVNCNNMVVQNQNYSYTSIGITVSYCEDIQLVNNTCNNNRESGIYIKESNTSTIIDNTCNGNDWSGIYLQSSSSLSGINNTCNGNCIYGIYLLFLNSSTFAENTCNCNHLFGISFYDSDFSVIDHNTCNNNTEVGISLVSSDHNSIIWNLLVGNGDYGVTVSKYSNTNSIHHNSFIRNGQNTSQAYDAGSNNQWYDETVLEGNYWSDYSGTGSYLIAGSADVSDLYPSLPPTAKPEIFSSAFIRVGLFLIILGILGVSIFLVRHPKST